MTDELLEGELIEAVKPTIAYQAHAFSQVTHFGQAVEGQTVAATVASLNFPADYDGFVHVWLNDLPLNRDQWESTVPAAGQVVYVRVVPRGGGSGKDILRTVAIIAIAVVAWYYAPVLAGYAAGSAGWAAASAAGFSSFATVAAISAGVTILGTMAVNALIPPPKLEFDSGGGLGSARNQLTGSSNRYAPYAPIPRVFGKRRVYPLLAGRPFSETQGDDEYLRMALLVGWGPLKISDIRIGETPIASYSNVEVEIREGWIGGESYGGTTKAADANLTLYTTTITESSLSVVLSPPATGPVYSYSTRTSDTNVTEISVDITAIAGLARFENNGSRSSIEVDVIVQYAVAGTTNWLTPVWLNSTDTGLDINGTIRLVGGDTSTIRRTGRFAVSAGQYDVRIYRYTTEFDTTKHVQEVRWTAMRSVKPSYPVQQKGLCLIALRMKATGQLNGVPQTISCIAESYLPVYSGSTWAYAITRNPAWAYADILRRRSASTYLTDDRLDLTTIKAWADACDATAPNASEARWTFDGVIEGGTVFQVLRQIASSARANYTVRDGKHSVVRDIQQTVPIQVITPRNSWGYQGSKAFLDYPHALRATFVNAAKNYEEDERIVYDDGYDASNATRFETLELYGCTSETLAYREARYYIAAARLRPESHVMYMDIESLRCTIGDLVQFQHDAVSIGIGTARITSITGTTIVFDQVFDAAAGSSYGIRVRKATGDVLTVSLANPAASTDTFTATSSVTGVAAGDLAMFGYATSISAPMLVKRIEPGPDFTAKLTLVDAQDGVYTADTGTIPPFNSNISTPAEPNNTKPEAPTIVSIRSDATASLVLPDGTVQSRMAVAVSTPASSVVRIASYDAQWKSSTEANWKQDSFDRGAQIYLAPIQLSVTYQVRVRSVSEYGVPSDWSATSSHTVTSVSAAPSVPTSFAASSITGGVHLTWVNPVDRTFDLIEVWESTTSTAPGQAGAALVNIDTIKGSVYDRLGLAAADGVRYYWIRALNTSQVASAYVGPVSATATTTSGIQTATVYLYQWGATQPANPSAAATSTYTWATAAHTGYNGADGWSVTVPTNPGTPGLKLWTAAKGLTAASGATSTSVTWTANTYSVYAASQNAAGLQNGKATVYRWALTIPVAPSGAATYTWSSGTFGSAPTGWYTSKPTAIPGFTCWAATVALTDASTATTSSFNWTAATISPVDYSLSTTAAVRAAFARYSSGTATEGNVSVSGDNLPPANSWGVTATWTSAPPDSGGPLYVSDGIFDSATNVTVWAPPYLAGLKVGSLSALTVNTGRLNINDQLTIGAGGFIEFMHPVTGSYRGYVSSGHMGWDDGSSWRWSGNGFGMGSARVGGVQRSAFMIGSKTDYAGSGSGDKFIEFDGNTFYVKGGIITTASLSNNAATYPIGYDTGVETQTSTPATIDLNLGSLWSDASSASGMAVHCQFSVVVESSAGYCYDPPPTLQVKIYRSAPGYAGYALLYDHTINVSVITKTTSGVNEGGTYSMTYYLSTSVPFAGMAIDASPIPEYYRMAVIPTYCTIKRRTFIATAVRR